MACPSWRWRHAADHQSVASRSRRAAWLDEWCARSRPSPDSARSLARSCSASPCDRRSGFEGKAAANTLEEYRAQHHGPSHDRLIARRNILQDEPVSDDPKEQHADKRSINVPSAAGTNQPRHVLAQALELISFAQLSGVEQLVLHSGKDSMRHCRSNTQLRQSDSW